MQYCLVGHEVYRFYAWNDNIFWEGGNNFLFFCLLVL